MPSDDDSSKNPFVRFKEHVDAHIGAGLHNVLNFPSILSETFASSRQLSPYDSSAAPSRPSDDVGAYHGDDDVPPHFRRWLYGQRQAVAEEEYIDKYYERIAQNYPGDENEAVRNIIRSERFDAFARRSQYSPIRLAERMPRQPRPSDIQSDMDPRLFTYVDAFEDLLAEAAGVPPMDLRARHNMNKMLRNTWPFGESPVSWARRLESQGLVKAYFPAYHHLPSLKPANEAVNERRIEQPKDEQPAATNDLLQGGGIVKEPEEQPAEDGFFGEIERAVKLLNQVLDETTSMTSRFWEQEKTRDETCGEPRTEHDLYDAIQSAFREGQLSLSAFFKSLADGIEPRPRSGVKSEADGQTIEQEENGMKTVKSTKEYVDEFGNKHISTEIRRTNKEGTVISMETYHTVRPASEADRSSITTTPSHQEEPKNEGWVDNNDPEDKKTGWFWK
ncbi:hypothetical protein NKR19_g8720 [Coniochaeta hoffmannii]|uniref:Uncharacterized protein n=1 Tax=Coniochaeta hoffmannii TaxID=91930 RepID=A0AA38VBY9_9PEZI|nr:hypothetical protein NKR19_g8720 [Coniochaeta hoffmannii]